jgi:hypothetical protein
LERQRASGTERPQDDAASRRAALDCPCPPVAGKVAVVPAKPIANRRDLARLVSGSLPNWFGRFPELQAAVVLDILAFTSPVRFCSEPGRSAGVCQDRHGGGFGPIAACRKPGVPSGARHERTCFRFPASLIRSRRL